MHFVELDVDVEKVETIKGKEKGKKKGKSKERAKMVERKVAEKESRSILSSAAYAMKWALVARLPKQDDQSSCQH